jgi:hypothetical protein
MKQPQDRPSQDPSLWPSLEMLGLKTPRPPLVLRHRRLVIGSSDRAQIRLKSFDIAARHAVISSSPTGWLLCDLDSATGTFVNDRRVQEVRLDDADEIRIGPFVFCFREAVAVPAAPPLELSPVAAPPDSPPGNSLVRPARVDSTTTQPAAQKSSGFATTKSSSVAGHLAPARLRPAIGRRRRPPPQNRANATQDFQSDPPPDDADAPAEDFDEAGEELSPQSPRSRVVGHFLLMLVCMGVAAALVWRMFPPTYLIRAAVTFQSHSGESLAKNKTFVEQQESLFFDDRVRLAAIQLLAHPKGPSAAVVDAGFLSQPGQVRAVGGLTWAAPTGQLAPCTLAFLLRSHSPAADAARATALVQAFWQSRKPSTRASIADLKIELLQSEVNGLQREVKVQSQNPQQTRKEIESLENATPSETRIDLMENRETSLRAALETAMKERILAELGLLNPDTVAPGATTKKSATLPVTAPARFGHATQPTTAPLRAAAHADSLGPDATSAHARRISKARQRETALREELSQAVHELVESKIRSQRLMEQKQRAANLQAELPRLQTKLKEKDHELAQLKKENSAVEVLAVEDARVVSVQDSRGLYTAAAIAGIAIFFGLLMSAAARGAA